MSKALTGDTDTGGINYDWEFQNARTQPAKTFNIAGVTSIESVELAMRRYDHQEKIYTSAAGDFTINGLSFTWEEHTLNVPKGEYEYDLKVTYDTDQVKNFMHGLIIVRKEVTPIIGYVDDNGATVSPPIATSIQAADITDATADGIALITSADANPFTDADKTKLDGIATSVQAADITDATADGIALITSADANPFTDADKTKLDGIATSVQAADITDATADGIALITSTDANPFTDADKTKLDGIATSVQAADITDATADGIALITSADANPFTDADKTKLDGIATSIQAADITDATADGIALITSADANPFTDADKTKLDGIATSIQAADITDATADGIALITSADANPFTDADKTKLDGIATSIQAADITDATADGIALITSADANPFTDADKTKLDGIATSATANSTDAVLLNRANHTGTQSASTIGSGTFADARISSSSVIQHEASLTLTESQISDLGNYRTDSVATDRILGRVSSGTGAIEDLTATQVRTLLNVEDGATAGGGLTLATEVDATNGGANDFTAIDFTGISSGVSVVYVHFDNVSLDAGVDFYVQIGDSGGIETTGYNSGSTSKAGSVNVNSSNAFVALRNSGDLLSGTMTLTRMSGNKWVETHQLGRVGNMDDTRNGSGIKTLSGELTQLRFTSQNGTANFDNGNVNVISM